MTIISPMRSRRRIALAGLLAVFGFSPAAIAQERILTIGLGAQLAPKFPGADNLSVSPLPYFDLRREGEPLSYEAADEGWGFGLLGDGPINIGPAVAFQSSRDNEDIGAPLDEVGWTLEAGAFIETYLSPGFRLRGEVRRGINGHEGWVGDVGADAIIQARPDLRMSIGPRLRLSDNRYMDAYFGVEPDAAARTGLVPYDPDGGIHSVGATAGFDWQFDRTWGLYGYARYDRLVGDAEDSPIVRAYGSANQFSVGLGLNYTFSLGS